MISQYTVICYSILVAEVGIQHVNMGMSAFGKSSHWQATWKSGLRGVWGMSPPTAQNTLILVQQFPNNPNQDACSESSRVKPAAKGCRIKLNHAERR